MFRKSIWLLTIAFFSLTALAAKAEMVSVSVDIANLRSGPGTEHPEQWKVIKGFPLDSLKKEGDWLQVKDFEGDVTWISQSLTSKEPYVIVTGDIVNLRDQSSTAGKIVGKVKYGTVLQKVEAKDGWIKVKLDNTVAWIAKDFVWGF